MDARTKYILDNKELIHTIIRRSGVATDDVEDCYQSTLLASLENQSEHNPSQSGIKTYSVNFVKYKIIDFKRINRRIQETPVDPANLKLFPSHSLDMSENEIEKISKNVISKLSYVAKIVCEMITDGYSAKEIMEKLKISRQRVNYIKSILRKLTENELEENYFKGIGPKNPKNR